MIAVSFETFKILYCRERWQSRDLFCHCNFRQTVQTRLMRMQKIMLMFWIRWITHTISPIY